jgi:hypothetical protein
MPLSPAERPAPLGGRADTSPMLPPIARLRAVAFRPCSPTTPRRPARERLLRAGLLAAGLLVGTRRGYGQTVDVIEVRTFGRALPHQTCQVTRRPAVGTPPTDTAKKTAAGDATKSLVDVADTLRKGGAADSAKEGKTATKQAAKPATRDTILLIVRSSDGRSPARPSQPLTLWVNGIWQGALPPDDGAQRVDTLAVGAPVKTWSGATAMVQTESQQVCSVTLAAAETPKDEADAALTFRFGPEYTSANNFAADKRLAATVGVRWDLASAPLIAPSWRPLRWLRVSTAMIGTFDYTSAVAAREHRSCNSSAIVPYRADRPVTLATPPAEYLCGPGVVTTQPVQAVPGRTLDTLRVTYPILRSDSVRAQVVPTWRAFVTTRLEFENRAGLRVGPVGGVGLQTDPRGLRAAGYSNTNRPLHPLWNYGGGLRKVTKGGVEVFGLDVLYGAVQNYYEADRVVVPREAGKPDSILKIAPDPVIIAYRAQLHTIGRLRLFKGASLRAYATFNAPQDGIPLDPDVVTTTSRPRARGFPDIVRVAFLLDRDVKKVWDTLVGTEGTKEGGGTDKSTGTGDKSGTSSGSGGSGKSGS